MVFRSIALGVMFILAACGTDDVGNDGTLVGGPCGTAAECQFRCETGGAYPQGTCTAPCNTDNDCPDGTHCINDEGGVCLLACDVPSDCRGGYNCVGRENRGTGGDSLVCRN